MALRPRLLTAVKVTLYVPGLDVSSMHAARPEAEKSWDVPHTVTPAVRLPSLASLAVAPPSQGSGEPPVLMAAGLHLA